MVDSHLRPIPSTARRVLRAISQKINQKKKRVKNYTFTVEEIVFTYNTLNIYSHMQRAVCTGTPEPVSAVVGRVETQKKKKCRKSPPSVSQSRLEWRKEEEEEEEEEKKKARNNSAAARERVAPGDAAAEGETHHRRS